MLTQSDTNGAASAAALSDNNKHETASYCSKKNIFPSPNEISHLDSDEEEELGASIYKSSLTARKRQAELISQQGEVSVLDPSVDISTNNDENDLECEHESNNRDTMEVNQLDVVEGIDLSFSEVDNPTHAARKRNQPLLEQRRQPKRNCKSNIHNSVAYQWDAQFDALQLQRHKNEHGNCFLPKKYSGDPQLGLWVIKQRTNAKAGKLTDDQRKRLESIGFGVHVQDDGSKWDEQFAVATLQERSRQLLGTKGFQ
ncbi:hypothetical protein ACHAXR_000526 [Thalassiosira sp. AJA248-18]